MRGFSSSLRGRHQGSPCFLLPDLLVWFPPHLEGAMTADITSDTWKMLSEHAAYQGRAQHAFFELSNSQLALPDRLQAHPDFREATTAMLALEVRQNQLGVLKPWDLEVDAKPLTQQTMIEADIADA